MIYRIIFFFLASLTLLVSCKKEAKWQVFVNMNALMPHNNTPIAGIKWKIVESKGEDAIISFQNEPTGWEMEGVTDAAGLAIANFHPKKDLDYSYNIYFDYSSMDVPDGEYDIVHGPTTFALILREEENSYDIRVLPKMDIDLHFKNVNCFDANDTFKSKSFNISENINLTQAQMNSASFIEGSIINGCADNHYFVNKLAGQYIYIWEATRNNITTTGIDTFYVEPGGNDLIEFFW